MLWWIDLIFNMETKRMDKMRERRLERLREKSLGKTNPRRWLNAKIERIERRQERLKNVAAVTAPIVDSIVSVVPGGAIVGNVLSKVIPDKLAQKLPVLGDLAVEGRAIVDSEQKAGLNWPQIVLRDIVPLLREFEEGDTKGIALGLLFFGGILLLWLY